MRKKIGFLLFGLDRSGGERACVELARLLQPLADIRLIAAGGAAAGPRYAVPDGVGFVELKEPRASAGAKRMRFAIESCEDLDGVVAMFAWQGYYFWRGFREKKSRPDFWMVDHVGFQDKSMPSFLEHRLDGIYGMAKSVVAVNEEDALEHRRRRPWLDARFIPNVPSSEFLGDPSPIGDRPKRLLGLGRLSPEKGFDRLIGAFARVARKHPDWRLDILGEGAERGNLERLRDRLGMKDRIGLPGVSERVSEELSESSAFALPSRRESYGYALQEALLSGTPSVAMESAGPRLILREHPDSFLLASQEESDLVRKLDELMGDASLRERLSRSALASRERLDPRSIQEAWREVLGI